MSGDILFVSQEHHPFSIRRDVREPVVVVVRKDLLLLGAVGFHPPDLHMPATLGIEVDVLTVWRVFGTVIETFRSCETRFISAKNRDCVDVEVATALADERQRLSVCRPAMPI